MPYFRFNSEFFQKNCKIFNINFFTSIYLYLNYLLFLNKIIEINENKIFRFMILKKYRLLDDIILIIWFMQIKKNNKIFKNHKIKV